MEDLSKEKTTSSEQLSDILLVLDKEKMKIMAVKDIDEKGNMKTINPSKENQNKFLRVDKYGDMFTNFFSNFFSQLRNPTNFTFFKVPSLISFDVAKHLQEHVDKPNDEGRELFKKHVLAETLKQNTEVLTPQNNMTMESKNENKEYRYQPDQIDWETMNNLGIGKEKLEKMNLLEPLLKGYKTNELVPINLNLGSAITRLDAKLSLQTNEQGQVIVAIHGIRKEPNLNFEFFGHKFSKEDKENLLTTGNMGRKVDLTNPKTGETIPSLVSIDRQTNELVALRTDVISIPDDIKGVKLNKQQKEQLSNGMAVHLEGMQSKSGASFDAYVQFNAEKRYIEFQFDRTPNLSPTNRDTIKEVPRSFRGKELDQEQYEKFKDGHTVYISGLVDKKGKEYNGYINFNKDTQKIDFSFHDASKLKNLLQPTQAHKTQVAVNSEGKTNESTKNSKEALNSGQSGPDERSHKKETTRQQKKSKGPKI